LRETPGRTPPPASRIIPVMLPVVVWAAAVDTAAATIMAVACKA
jgi:hypothetical protein